MPVIVLNFNVEDQYYDINVTPDKREVFLKNEQEIITELKQKLHTFFEENSKIQISSKSQEKRWWI